MNNLFHIPSLSNINAYKAAVYAIKDLDHEEEIFLSNDYLINNNLESAQKLIFSQLKTVVKISNEFTNYGLSMEELIQEGNIGLMKAVKNFDPNKGYRLYTFSIVWIKSEIQNYILNNWKIFKIGSTKEFKKLFFNYRNISNQLKSLGYSSQEISQEISKKLMVDEKDVIEAKNYFENDLVLIDSFENNEDDHYISYPKQLIEFNSPEKKLQEKEKQVFLNLLKSELKNLSENEQIIINERFLQENKKTHKEISKKIGISSERVRQIEEKAINNLRKKLIKI